MSMIYCPECGHEISTAAVACPNCGRPLSALPSEAAPPVVVPVERRSGGVPNWIFIPLGIIGALLLIVFFVVMSRNSPDANSNVGVNVSARRNPVNAPAEVGSNASTPSQSVTVPGMETNVSLPPDKATVTIKANISVPPSETPKPVKNEKFYLLDKDLEAILTEARIQPIEGQNLINSFGLSVVYPDRFGDFHRDALLAIKDHVKYAGTTDAAGKVELGSVVPNSYYVFGVTKSGHGFAVWSSPVSIVAGENSLSLTPMRLTDMPIDQPAQPTGEN